MKAFGNAWNRNTNENELLSADRVASRSVAVQLKSVNKATLIFFHQRINWLNGN